MTNDLHQAGVVKHEEKIVSAMASIGNDGRVGIVVQNGESWASILMTPTEAQHFMQVISDALASAESASLAS